MINLPLLTVTANAPADLDKQLRDILKAPHKRNYLLTLALTDPHVLVYPFSFDHVPLKDLKIKLMFEAVGLVSLPADEVKLDYQILMNEGDVIKGIFICMPKRLLNEYLKIVYKSGLIPIGITSVILSRIDFFLMRYGNRKERLCLIDFYQNHLIHIAVFHNGQCELLRKIDYEGTDEAWKEVVQSLRSVTARSADKQGGRIYVSGDVKEDVVKKLAENFQTGPETVMADWDDALGDSNRFFSLNVIRDEQVQAKEREKILQVMKCLLIVALLGCSCLTFNIWKIHKEIQMTTASYKKADYEYAQKLQERVRLLKL